MANEITLLGHAVQKDITTVTAQDLEGCEVIGDSVFVSCSHLTSVTIPDSVTRISDYAFEHCSSLTNITIPNNVTRIGVYAFYSCTSLTSITIGSGATTISGNAFNNCTSLTSITSLNTTPPTIYSNTFYNVPTSIPVYVPPEAVTAYQSAQYWSNFTNIQAIQQ